VSINPPAGPVPSQPDPPYPATGPGPARAHVRRLRRDGRTYRAIANAAGLDRATVSDLARGRRRPKRGTAAAVLAVTSKSVPRGRVDAGGTRLRLRALHVMGHGSARIARALGVREMTIRQIVRGDARTVSPRLRDKVSDLYDAWWDKRAPARTPSDRAAATAARKRAIAGNWCAGAALDDDLLDIRGYRPRHGWKPATGTGVAPDQPPSGRYAPHPGPAGGRAGHAGNRRPLRPAVPGSVAAPPEVRDRRRPAPRLAARPAALPGRAPRSRDRPHP
jgi:hypothetical protein